MLLQNRLKKQADVTRVNEKSDERCHQGAFRVLTHCGEVPLQQALNSLAGRRWSRHGAVESAGELWRRTVLQHDPDRDTCPGVTDANLLTDRRAAIGFHKSCAHVISVSPHRYIAVTQMSLIIGHFLQAMRTDDMQGENNMHGELFMAPTEKHSSRTSPFTGLLNKDRFIRRQI